MSVPFDLDGDTSDASDQIKSVDGVVIDLSATATDTEGTPVKYATEANGVITLGANAGNLAAGDKLTSIENVTGSGFNDVLIGDDEANRLAGGDGDDILDGGAGADTLDGGARADTLDGGADSVRDTLTGGGGNDIFVVSADDGTDLAGADLVTDFASGDKIQISLSQDDINTIKGEANAADKLDKLLELANLEVTNNADAGHSTTDKPDNDTVLTNKGADKALGGGDDTVLMILEDYSTDLTFDDFAPDVL
jgi:Ca2+-binding RTX toxin-like protein